MKYKWKDYSQSFTCATTNDNGSNSSISPPVPARLAARKNSIPNNRYTPLGAEKRLSLSSESFPQQPLSLSNKFAANDQVHHHQQPPAADLLKTLSEISTISEDCTHKVSSSSASRPSSPLEIALLDLSMEESASLLHKVNTPPSQRRPLPTNNNINHHNINIPALHHKDQQLPSPHTKMEEDTVPSIRFLLETVPTPQYKSTDTCMTMIK